MELASRSRRLIGQSLDGLVMAVPVLAALLGFLASEVLGVMLVIGMLLLGVVYYFFADALPGGQSYGKRAMGIQVLEEGSNEPCSAAQSFVRNLLLAVLGPIDWLFIFGESRQRLGDRLARTIVVNVPRSGASVSDQGSLDLD